MPKVPVFTTSGAESRTIELSEAVFNEEKRPDLAHRVVIYQLAKRRSGNASTKERNEISGSSRKLFRQKGTGRARRGSIKSPLLRGGGTIFGPKPRDYAQSLPKKVRRKALASVLSEKLRSGELLILEPFLMTEPKTKDLLTILESLQLPQEGLLFVTGNNEDGFLNLRLSANNLPKTKTLKSMGVNVYDVLNCRKMVVTVKGVEEIEARFLA